MMYKLSISGLALQLAGMRQSVNEATMHKCRVLGYVFTRFESPTMTSEKKKKQQKSIEVLGTRAHFFYLLLKEPS